MLKNRNNIVVTEQRNDLMSENVIAFKLPSMTTSGER